VAKPGDVVEFKSGLHGLEAPRNLGILLTRERRKGTPWVRLMTDAGALDLKQEHLSRRLFQQRYDGRIADEADVQARLRQLLAQHAGTGLAEEVEDDLGLLEQQLWEATAPGAREAWTDEEIAEAHYGAEASNMQRKQVREALDRCRRAGLGRFETVSGRGDTWRPWTLDERARMAAAWTALGQLKSKMIQAVDSEDGRRFVPVPMDSAQLGDADEQTLDWARAAMVQFIEHDGVPEHDIAGLGGLGATMAFGMDLHRQLGFLAGDWIASESTKRSSDYVHFLLETGAWSADDAVAGLMRRHVNQEQFFQHQPDEEAEARANELPEPDIAQDPEREDLRHLECFTIDPPDAKDFDDAVGLEQMPDGVDRLWVHIADVSHYVRPGTRLDKHAKDRATSVYLPGRVLPMLPHRVADHLCSLRDDGDRFALSVHMDVAKDGKIAAAGCHVSMIRVNENMAYADALARRDAGAAPFTQLFELATRMRTQRRGMELDTGELRVTLHDAGFSALEKRADDATRMIETFMVAANEAVASFLSDRQIPLLFRCHPLPDATKAERFGHQLKTMGFDLELDLPKTASTKAAATQSLLEQLKSGGGKMQLFGGGLGAMPLDEPEEASPEDTEIAAPTGFAALSPEDQEAWLAPFRHVIDGLAQSPRAALADVATLKILACMGQAYYTPDNEGHFGLGSTYYCHFTSPIRRYPDLVVHRNLKAHLRGETLPHPGEDLQRMCDHCSDQERAASSLERRLKSACLVLASMEGPSQAPARITGITPASVFVRRDDGIEARAAARDLPGGPYSVDEWESMLFLSDREAPQRFEADELAHMLEWYDEDLGEQRRIRAKLGDRVTVRLTGREVADGRTGADIVHWRLPNAAATD
jgi:ribonuclease R